MRTALVPDVAVLDRRPYGASFPAAAAELVVEVWSPGNGRGERESKIAAYAAAGVPYLWTVEQHPPALAAFELEGGVYRARDNPVAPIPVTIDPADFIP